MFWTCCFSPGTGPAAILLFLSTLETLENHSSLTKHLCCNVFIFITFVILTVAPSDVSSPLGIRVTIENRGEPERLVTKKLWGNGAKVELIPSSVGGPEWTVINVAGLSRFREPS